MESIDDTEASQTTDTATEPTADPVGATDEPTLPPPVRAQRHEVRRRTFLFGAGAAAAAAGIGGWAALNRRSPVPLDTGEPAAAEASITDPSASYLSIIAHCDDDLYFFNPDVVQAIRAGSQVTTVVLTAGEADGKNIPFFDPGWAAAPASYPNYTEARYNGLRAAYSEMATGARTADWKHETLDCRGGAVAEVHSITTHPTVRLVFLNICQDIYGDQTHSPVLNLWQNVQPSIPTLAPTNSPVNGATYSYTRDALLGTLLDILAKYRPTVIRTMDPDPEHLVHDGLHPQNNDYGDYTDHADHTAAGLFAFAAIQLYQVSDGNRTTTEAYRGYVNQRYPASLSPTALTKKLGYLGTYGWADGKDCGDPVGCGDKKVGGAARSVQWGNSTAYRYPGNTTWMQLGADRRLAAFAVLGGQAWMWQETAPASGTFRAPQPIGGLPLAPHVAVAQTSDGRWQVFGMQMTLGPADTDQHRVIASAVQNAPGGAFGAWYDLGTPSNVAEQRRGIGAPAVGVNADGRLQVFVRNWNRGLSSCVQGAGGVWEPWTDLAGLNLIDPPTVLSRADADGRIEIYAAASDGIQLWRQREPNGFPALADLPVPAPAGQVGVARAADGTVHMVARQPDSGWLIGYSQSAAGGGWNPQPVILGGHGGFGPVAAVATKDGVAVVQRNDAGTVSVGWWDPAVRNQVPLWHAGGPLFVHSPAAAVDSSGLLVVATVGPDGRLFTVRQDPKKPRMGRWKLATE